MSRLLIRGLWSYHQGYVIIKVKGSHIEEFLNRASKEGIYLWQIERLSPELLIARVSVSGFRRLREIVRSVPVTVRIRQRMGLPFLKQKLGQRIALLAGAILSILCIYMLSSIVWFVQIHGAEQLDTALVNETLQEAGIRPGVWRSSIDSREIEKQLMLNLPQLAWAGVRLRGTLLEVTIVEKVEMSVDERVPGDIVADKNALVTQIIPFVGTVLVEEGETVTEGQVLIDGGLGGPDSMGQGVGEGYLRAAGMVKGRVWYKGFGEADLVCYVSHRTGRVQTTHRLSIGAWHWDWGELPPFDSYEEETKRQRPAVARLKWELPIELVTTDYHELVTERVETDPDVAKETALRRSWEAIEARLTPKAEILSQEVELITEERNGDTLIRVKRIVEVHEEIGTFRARWNKEAKEIREGSR